MLDEWDGASERLAASILQAAGSAKPARDARLLAGAVDGLRLHELARGGFDREQVERQLERLVSVLVRDA